MAYWALSTYTRPDTSREFYIRRTVAEVKTSSVIGAKIVEFENAGKIIHYSINYSEDLLTQKVKIGFDTEESYNEFKTYCESEDEYTTLKSDFITNNSLTVSVVDSAEEPSV
tara:strand:+ start:1151 stop:1486 length:336 start_codon:yes stop_codon:yes gene_type:complete